MGRNLSNNSQSPIRGRGSSPRRSPSRRDRSPPPARHRSSHRDGSPARDKRTSRPRSPKREMSRSSSPPRHKSSQKDSSAPTGEKISVRARSPRCERSRSPSPRAKRLRRAQAEREAEKVIDIDHARNHRRGDDKGTHRERMAEKGIEREHERTPGKGGDKGHREREAEREHERNHGRGSASTHRERGGDKERGERRERRSGRDEIDGKSSRSRHGRSASPSDRHYRSNHRSRSPQLAVDTRERDEVTKSRRAERGNGDDYDNDDSVAKMRAAEEALEAKQKQQPSFELSGKLAAETNRVRGVTLLFTEPPDARKPDVRWRLYVFKSGEVLNEPLYIHRQSCYLFGRERRIADVPTDHPSCSKQHAVIQFRQVEKEQSDGTLSKQPGICAVARELCRMTGINLLPQFVSLSAACGRVRNILFACNSKNCETLLECSSCTILYLEMLC